MKAAGYFLMLLGRLCLATIFLISGWNKLTHYDENVAYMASKGMTMIPFFLISAAIVELLGGLSLILGFKTRWGAFLLTAFLTSVTAIMHDFWNLSGSAQQIEQISFLKNLAIIGGLLYVWSCGSGYLACDRCSKERA